MSEPTITRDQDARRFMLGPDAWIVRAGGGDTEGRFDLIEATVSYLQGPPLHLHHEQSDSFLVLSGTLKVQIGEDLLDLHPGDMATAPPGIPHTYANLEREPARIINLMSPGGFDRALEAFSLGGFADGPPSPEALARVSREHKLEMVGPPITVRLGLV